MRKWGEKEQDKALKSVPTTWLRGTSTTGKHKTATPRHVWGGIQWEFLFQGCIHWDRRVGNGRPECGRALPHSTCSSVSFHHEAPDPQPPSPPTRVRPEPLVVPTLELLGLNLGLRPGIAHNPIKASHFPELLYSCGRAKPFLLHLLSRRIWVLPSSWGDPICKIKLRGNN